MRRPSSLACTHPRSVYRGGSRRRRGPVLSPTTPPPTMARTTAPAAEGASAICGIAAVRALCPRQLLSRLDAEVGARSGTHLSWDGGVACSAAEVAVLAVLAAVMAAVLALPAAEEERSEKSGVDEVGLRGRARSRAEECCACAGECTSPWSGPNNWPRSLRSHKP